ncbi:hypothetical protein LTR56_022854 [Elasticomyces elasticus]|nr:hypothetical protein LTR56_022854 [Elasticomyces elasticus]KAK3627452.1 hypothetical protein LTR22_022728 [Elasticomyces elasticus]KAK4907611.1 hypothetical protein LTR49_023364 [Elasticomyces elasticus]KAK5743030.1 hypothetical protein LTS12_024023 [Elasticomyces elasticus]
MKYIDYEPDLKQRVSEHSGKDRSYVRYSWFWLLLLGSRRASIWFVGYSHCCPVGLLDVLIVAREVDGGGQAVHTAMKEIVEDDEYPRYQDNIINDDHCDVGAHQEFGSGSSSSSSNSSLPRRRRSANLVTLLREEEERMGNVREEIEREWPALETGAAEDYFPVIEEEGVVFVGAPLPELGDEGRGAGTGRALGEEPGYWERDD